MLPFLFHHRKPSLSTSSKNRIAGVAALVLALFSGLAGCATAPQAPPTVLAPPPPPPMTQAQMAPVQAQATREAPTGSVWNESSGSLFRDHRARKVGDILTITVVEESKGTKEASTKANKDKSLDGSFKFGGVSAGNSGANSPVGAFSFGPYQGQFKNDFTGKGSTSRTDSMTAYMTATVVDVLPNGNLLIRGSRWTKVNDEMQQTILEGIVRPIDISRNNTIQSQQIAEAKIFLVGKGPVSKHQKPGWLSQFIDAVNPF
ncbi:MAG: flagellar basal body L-ring protein FlgH [Syntrophobacteraceae bacterium]|nr:flagellar basal body L-ring protein FlgH [Syntrophobacteraceae bacterium]